MFPLLAFAAEVVWLATWASVKLDEPGMPAFLRVCRPRQSCTVSTIERTAGWADIATPLPKRVRSEDVALAIAEALSRSSFRAGSKLPGRRAAYVQSRRRRCCPIRCRSQSRPMRRIRRRRWHPRRLRHRRPLRHRRLLRPRHHPLLHLHRQHHHRCRRLAPRPHRMKRPQPRRPTSRLSTSSTSLHSFKIDAGAQSDVQAGVPICSVARRKSLQDQADDAVPDSLMLMQEAGDIR
jgi:hypothetical protein